MKPDTTQNFLVGALIGSAIGAAVALVFTPMSGERLRRRIKKGLNHPFEAEPPRRASHAHRNQASAHHTRAHTSSHNANQHRGEHEAQHGSQMEAKKSLHPAQNSHAKTLNPRRKVTPKVSSSKDSKEKEE